jgi:hypothetical protein
MCELRIELTVNFCRVRITLFYVVRRRSQRLDYLRLRSKP